MQSKHINACRIGFGVFQLLLYAFSRTRARAEAPTHPRHIYCSILLLTYACSMTCARQTHQHSTHYSLVFVAVAFATQALDMWGTQRRMRKAITPARAKNTYVSGWFLLRAFSMTCAKPSLVLLRLKAASSMADCTREQRTLAQQQQATLLLSSATFSKGKDQIFSSAKASNTAP